MHLDVFEWKKRSEQDFAKEHSPECVEQHCGLLETQWSHIASLEGFDPETAKFLDGSGRAELPALGRWASPCPGEPDQRRPVQGEDHVGEGLSLRPSPQ
jgi:hypothetical protein